MADDLSVPATTLSKQEKYEMLLPQINSLVASETDLISNLANITSALKYGMNWLWVGFYFVKKNQLQTDELILGPFQGPVACSRIALGKGVCGTAWLNNQIIIVDDVDLFPGHIACSSLSKSEIVLPVLKNGIVEMILDIDSDQLACFDETDKLYLMKVVSLIQNML